LTGFHFTVTALVGWISRASGYSASKHVPLWELVWFSLVANTSITGMNLSLMLNSVGFYQVRYRRPLAMPFYRLVVYLLNMCEIADFQAEHDSGRLLDGMGDQQQALHHQGHIGSGCRGSRCGDLHGHRCRGQRQGLRLRLRRCVLHIASADCELIFPL
jgi:hypothetical protein